ncbi:MAG: 30S ribosomal protein S4 [Myxococcota bacterium]
MSRYTGPRLRKMRAVECDLPGLSPKTIWDRRPYPPGQHGPNRRRGKFSDFKLQLLEKQKLRFNYGVTERQLTRLFRESQRRKGNTGDTLLELLERRLDNVIFRAGFTVSIPSSRQLVCHGHVQVNGKKVDIPSYRLSVGDVVSFRERSQSLALVGEAIEKKGRWSNPDWIKVDNDQRRAELVGLPTSESPPMLVEVQRVVEWYSRR